MVSRAESERREAKRQAKQLRRQGRREQWERDDQRTRSRQRVRAAGIGVLGLVSVTVVVAGLWFAFFQPRPGRSVGTSGAGVHTGQPSEGYSTTPPTSGPHLPQAPPWGVQDEISEPLQVHALEHGGVLVQYNCPESCAVLVSRLNSIGTRYESKVIVAPYSKMTALIALTSWGKIDLLDEFDVGRIEKFIEKNRNHAPESFVP
jgi:hypothetical protein